MTETHDMVALALLAVTLALLAMIGVAALWRTLRQEMHEQRLDMEGLKSSIDRLGVRVESERDYVLRPRDLGRIHDRINKVAEELAETRAQVSTETRMLSEQLRVLQRMIQENER